MLVLALRVKVRILLTNRRHTLRFRSELYLLPSLLIAFESGLVEKQVLRVTEVLIEVDQFLQTDAFLLREIFGLCLE